MGTVLLAAVMATLIPSGPLFTADGTLPYPTLLQRLSQAGKRMEGFLLAL
jgi:hypothetical protein